MDGNRHLFTELVDDLKITVRSMLNVYYETPVEERAFLEKEITDGLDELSKIADLYEEE